MNNEDGKDVILAGIEPLFMEAATKELWFWCRYQDLWFSPDELRAQHGNGKFIWGVQNWELRNPQEKVDQFAGQLEGLKREALAFAKRMHGLGEVTHMEATSGTITDMKFHERAWPCLSFGFFVRDMGNERWVGIRLWPFRLAIKYNHYS